MEIGFIGAGKMGGAILKGLIESGFVSSREIMASERDEESAQKVSKEYGIKTVFDNNQLVQECDVIVICTKPFVMKEVLEGIKNSVNTGKLVISIVAGVTTEKMEEILGAIPVVRVMPNTPAFLSCGMSVLSKGKYADYEHLNFTQEMFSQVGKAIILEENLMDAATGISGSGPAFMYLFIEALAKGGTDLGLDKDIALELASQTAIGAANMIMQTGKTPEDLRIEVTTPGGCTAVGLDVLAEGKVFDTLVETVKATAKKAFELGG
ncbi:MAG: pyrroline-5-carboxylate reductase [bacterium]